MSRDGWSTLPLGIRTQVLWRALYFGLPVLAAAVVVFVRSFSWQSPPPYPSARARLEAHPAWTAVRSCCQRHYDLFGPIQGAVRVTLSADGSVREVSVEMTPRHPGVEQCAAAALAAARFEPEAGGLPAHVVYHLGGSKSSGGVICTGGIESAASAVR